MAKNTKQTTVHIDETLLKEVKRIGINENKSISQIINESIIDYICDYKFNQIIFQLSIMRKRIKSIASKNRLINK